MAYSEQHMAEIARDPVRLRAYFWRVGTLAKLMAKRRQRIGALTPAALQAFSDAILGDLDSYVARSLQKELLNCNSNDEPE